MRRSLDLQAKISLVLVAVILPTFVIVTVAENKFTLPLLEEEIRQIGINSAKTLAAEIDGSRMLSAADPALVIDDSIQELIYSQPNIVRVDVFGKESGSGSVKLVVSNVEDEPQTQNQPLPLVDTVTTQFQVDERGDRLWDIYAPIEHKFRDPNKGSKKLLGTIHLVISTKLVGRIVSTLWKITAVAAGLSVISLILALGYFLRKTIANDRLLRQAESENLQLTEQLQEAHRQLMINEKLAVMGQLTASFAHEIGTPLNAIGGHLQLLKEEIPIPVGTQDLGLENRMAIINGQLQKIEGIVKGFLQSTAKPSSQKQLVDLNRLADKTLGILAPRMDSLGIEVSRKFERQIAPVRAVPTDLEQVLLNLLNNSVDSLKAQQGKSRSRYSHRSRIEVSTDISRIQGKEWAELAVYDTGEGIRKTDMKNVLKPFFTTKRPGEGTGLGLTISEQLAHKYGGQLSIDSKEGAWTRVVLRLPYHVNL